MQTICTSLQTEQHIITQFFTGWMLFLAPSQQCQSTEGKEAETKWHYYYHIYYTQQIK